MQKFILRGDIMPRPSSLRKKHYDYFNRENKNTDPASDYLLNGQTTVVESKPEPNELTTQDTLLEEKEIGMNTIEENIGSENVPNSIDDDFLI